MTALRDQAVALLHRIADGDAVPYAEIDAFADAASGDFCEMVDALYDADERFVLRHVIELAEAVLDRSVA